MTKAISVRYIVVLITLGTVLCTSLANANLQGAQAFVKEISDSALRLIKDANVADKKKEQKLVELFENVVDTKWIAKFALGSYWNSANEEQRKEYMDLHHKFLLSSYIPKFREYTNQKIAFKQFYSEGSNEYVIQTEITQVDKPSISVDYKVREENGTYRVYDVIAEGISLLTTQRSDFASILSRGGIEELIKKLKDKVNA